MQKIQICYDPMTVIPSDIDTIHKLISPFKPDFEFIDTFDKEDLMEGLPTIHVANLNIQEVEIIDKEKIIIKTKTLNTIPTIIESIKDLLND